MPNRFTSRLPRYLPGHSILIWIAVFGCATAAAQGSLPPTGETDIGIFYQPGAPESRNLWREGDPGERLQLRGRVLDIDGDPVADALVELWQADGSGAVTPDRYRTRLRSRVDGSFGVITALPGYIAGAPGVWGARHIHVRVTHPNYSELISLILFEGDPQLEGLPYPDLAVFVEQAQVEDREIRFAEVILVLELNRFR